jgi:hypothetical protein
VDFNSVPITILRVLDEDLEGREARPLFLVEVLFLRPFSDLDNARAAIPEADNVDRTIN